MYEDEPSDRVHDYLAEAVFGNSPLGRRILGQADVISGIPVPEIAAFHARRYTAPNLLVAAAGNVDHQAVHELAETLKPGPGEAHPIEPVEPLPGGQFVFAEKDTEQYHVCFGAPGINRADERRFGLAVLDSILGGSSSSRLFREVREERGLAYSVGTYSDQYTDTGMVAAYVGTREDNVEQACEVMGEEFRRIRSEPVSEAELERGKEHVKGRLVLSGESTAARMGRIARAHLHGLPILTLDEMLGRVDAVTVDDLTALAAELFAADRLSTAAVGGDRELFRDASQQVTGELAA